MAVRPVRHPRHQRATMLKAFFLTLRDALKEKILNPPFTVRSTHPKAQDTARNWLD